MLEIKLTSWPPGGWDYIEPSTGWKPAKPHSTTFENVAKELSEHRFANTKATQPHGVEKAKLDLLNYTRERLKHMGPIMFTSQYHWLFPKGYASTPEGTIQADPQPQPPAKKPCQFCGKRKR